MSESTDTFRKAQKPIHRETNFSDEDFVKFRDLIRGKAGIFFSDRKRADLKTGVLKAFHYSGMKNLRQYYDLLEMETSNSAVFKTLVSFLTIGETYFFRHFEVMERVILPQLTKAHQHDKTLRIWSAGCSTGEEPFTAAMVLYEILEDIGSWRIQIVGTDININSLQYAKEAVYRPWSLRSISDYYKNKYFRKSEGLYYLDERIRNMVSFDYLNLMDETYPSSETMTRELDLIFCRNVTIYFEAETTIRVVNRFYNCLKEKGYLAVGHAEPSSLIYDHYLSEIYPDAVMYRKDTVAKKEQQYKTGIRIRRDIFKEYKVQSAGTPANQPMAPKLSMLQKQIEKLKPDRKPEEIAKVETRPIPPKKSAEPAVKPVEERRLEMTESQLFSAGIDLFQQKDFQAAEKTFRDVLNINPKNGRALYMIAHIKANLDRIGEAKEFCFKAIESDSLLLEGYYLLGLIFKEENQFEDSVKMLKKVIYIDQNFAMGYYELAVNCFKLNDNVQANKYLRQTEKILSGRSPEERVGILDDMTVAELGMMIKMWAN